MKKKISLSLDDRIIKAGKRAAVSLETTLSEIVERLLRKWLRSEMPEELEELDKEESEL